MFCEFDKPRLLYASSHLVSYRLDVPVRPVAGGLCVCVSQHQQWAGAPGLEIPFSVLAFQKPFSVLSMSLALSIKHALAEEEDAAEFARLLDHAHTQDVFMLYGKRHTTVQIPMLTLPARCLSA